MSNPNEIVAEAIEDSIRVRRAYRQHLTDWLVTTSEKLVETLKAGGKILIAGNGGSAADSQHFAAELVVRLTSQFDREGLPAIALTTDSSVITAAANDYGFEKVFSRQVQALGNKGDVFIGLSTSGTSANVIEAFKTATEKSLATVGLFGRTGLAAESLCKYPLLVESSSTMRIQEEHHFALHLLVELTEILLFRKES
jgi:D-sedoheptulose 7-phosphate isomerase